MGLAGHATMWKSLHLAGWAETPIAVVWALWLAAASSLALFAVCFVAKLLLHWPRVRREWADAGRSQFFNAPNLAAMLLAISCPPSIHSQTGLRAVWVACGCYQATLVHIFYHRWMYGGTVSMESASTPYLLSV
eukprot:SAG22_NODE_5801_length_950_cov_1.262045_1_plen_133_part_10